MSGISTEFTDLKLIPNLSGLLWMYCLNAKRPLVGYSVSSMARYTGGAKDLAQFLLNASKKSLITANLSAFYCSSLVSGSSKLSCEHREGDKKIQNTIF